MKLSVELSALDLEYSVVHFSKDKLSPMKRRYGNEANFDKDEDIAEAPLHIYANKKGGILIYTDGEIYEDDITITDFKIVITETKTIVDYLDEFNVEKNECIAFIGIVYKHGGVIYTWNNVEQPFDPNKLVFTLGKNEMLGETYYNGATYNNVEPDKSEDRDNDFGNYIKPRYCCLDKKGKLIVEGLV